MIYLKDGNIPLNLAYDDDIVQEANSTYQLSFKFPLTDGKWNLLRREVFLLADDLHGEQEFFIFEVKKAKGHVQVYAKQVATLLNYYSINSISVDRVPGQTVMTALAGSVKRPCPFTFFSDILDRHTFNESNVSVMAALAKDKHSIVGQWGGDLVRDKYQVKLLKNGGIENESLFMYKKNLSSYEESENINNLKTRLHLKKTIKGQSEGEADRVIAVTVDSPLIGQYRQIYEADIEVNDQDVTDVASLTAYGKRYFSSTLCDLVENSINLDVKGKSDVSVKMFDMVSVFHERFDVDLRLKISSYHFGPMSKRLKSIGFGKVSQSFGSTVASMVAGSVDKATGRLSASFEQKLQKEIDNANRHFDAEFDKRVESINDGIEQAQAEAERYADAIKQEIDTEIAQVNQSMQAQSEEHDRQVADILSKTQSVESLANQAKSDAASALARANQVKTEAIADARAQVATVSQALNTAKSELQTAIASADQKARDSQASATALRNDLNLQASKILEQARAQTALTSRVTTVETLADGTRSTVAELSKTVSKATGDIASVTSRTKTVEDTLSQTRTQYEALTQTVNTQTGQIESINRRTADLQSGIDGVTERFENLRVGGRNLIPGTAAFSGTHWEKSGTWRLEESLYKGAGILTWVGGMKGSPIANISVQSGDTYTFSAYIKKENAGTVYFYLYDEHETWFAAANVPRETLIRDVGNNFQRFTITFKVTRSGILKPRFAIIASDTGGFSVAGYQLETGTVATDWTPAPEDIHSEIAIYKRTAEESSAELSRQIQLADGKAVEAKSYAQQTTDAIKTRLESLETYKNGESTRASQYFTASRDETARQITAERTAIANNYVAKSIYDENVRGTTLKLNEIKTTADTAKQNLATYRNTVDRKLEELTSSTQTIDRKINTASTKVDMVAGEIRTELSQVESKIPTEMSGNLILEGNRPWSSTSYLAKEYQLAEPLEEGKTYTFVIHWWRGSGASANYVPMVYYNSSTLQLISPNGTTALQESASRLRYDPNIDSWVATFTVKKRSQMTVEQLQVFDNRPPKLLVYRFGSNVKDQNGGWADTTQSNASFATLVKGNIPLSRWEPAYSELATVTALHNVTDTVKSHTRTIGAVGETGSILDNVSKVAQTAAGLVQEVSGTNGLKTQVGQLKNSWAVKISGPEGLKTAINASEDGIRFKGKNLWLDGNTLIDNAVITSAMIAGLDAGKITTGYLDAARIRVGAIDGSKIAFDEAFFNGLTANQAYLKKLFAKDAFITSVQAVAVSAKQIAGGIAKALNGGMDVNFDESKINFYTNVAAIRRIYTGHPTQFIKFETEGNYSRTIIGSNRNGGEVFNSATFAGVVVENTNNINTEDNVRIYGDSTLLRHAQGDVGWNINSVTQRIVPANMNAESEIWSKHFVAPDKNSKPVRLDTAVAALWDIWNHIIYNNFEFNEALRTHIKARRDNWKFELNL
ncbi:phage tail spike protein [Streptococcus suis]|uniref:phage tail spike protein n=1 Tax=Streptococcus suis TaxID=1307 RepID=UPI00094229B4|nr:phage tail spike protein [Streptococcus suis]